MGRRLNSFLSVLFSILLFASRTYPLRSYETQVLLQLRKHLEYPTFLNVWKNTYADFCTVSSPPQMSIRCENDSVTELRMMGDKPVKVSGFWGYAITNQTLSESFSIDSFVTTLARLSNLKVLSLVSLGIWGELPDKIHRLYSLEALDMSSNFMFGSIPSGMSRLVALQSFTLDRNFFNDTVPEWLDSLTYLTILSFKNNRLKGQVPTALSRMTALNELALSHNLISGRLPDLSNLSNLQLLDLRENKLDSALPPLPKGLADVFLSNNSFSGTIPEQLGQLTKLQHLDLSNNDITGNSPAVLFSLPNISYLNLSFNMLSGTLPEKLKCGEALSLVDLSGNKLTGQLPNCLNGTGNRIVNIRGNCFPLDAGGNQHSGSYCKDVGNRSGRSVKKEIAILAGVIGGLVIVVAILFVIGILHYCRKRCSRREALMVQHVAPKVEQEDPTLGASSELLANTGKMGNQNAPPYKAFSLEDLQEATKDFDESLFLGEGSLGKVYKGRLENGTLVAIRLLSLQRRYSIQNLRMRLDLLSKLHHPHLVVFLGYCIDAGMQDEVSTVSRLFLVQEFIPGGNFLSHLSETEPDKILKWSDRLSVLIGIAKAVHFLHTGVIPPSLNNRLKTSNILLDEHRIAKLGDYGMSLIIDHPEKSEAKGDRAKPGHDAESQEDVYDFGFILLESLVGPSASEKGEAFLLNEMTSFGSQDGRKKIVDPVVLTTSSQESLSIVISITNKCISSDSSNRPSIEDVLWNLQYAAQVQATADADQKSDTASQSELPVR